jgi:hypothetical protein
MAISLPLLVAARLGVDSTVRFTTRSTQLQIFALSHHQFGAELHSVRSFSESEKA